MKSKRIYTSFDTFIMNIVNIFISLFTISLLVLLSPILLILFILLLVLYGGDWKEMLDSEFGTNFRKFEPFTEEEKIKIKEEYNKVRRTSALR